MKKTGSLFCATISLALAVCEMNAQLSIASLHTEILVDFDTNLSGVNAGAFAGTGIVAAPNDGQLDSDAWRVTGLSAGDTSFGGDFTAASFTRGVSGGNTTSAGLHAFDTGGGNSTLGIQPLAGDFNPGTITLRIQNNTGAAVNQWNLSYDLFVFNDQKRSHSWDWAWSTDDITYNTIHEYNSTQALDSNGWVNVASPSISNLSATVANGGYLYLQWSGQNVSGTGGYDEFAIDDISIAAVPEPSMVALLVGLAGFLMVLRRKSLRA